MRLLATGAPSSSSRCGASGSRARSPTSTPRPSPPPTASARRCSAASACSATSSPTRRSWRTSPTCATRSSTTSTSASSPAAARRSSAARRRWRSRATAIDNPAAPIEPADAPDDDASRRCACGSPARRAGELEARKRRTGVMTYDDLLTRLSARSTGEGGAVAAARLRARYRVVLVDEFQDTDPVQWQIMHTAFGDGEVTLVLIGDPKQAIYAFRGADVYAYIEAARTAGAQATLTTNWRSDQGLLDAYDALFGGAKLGHEGIVYRQVRAANADARLHGAPDPAPLRIRVVPRDDVGLTAAGLRAPRARAPARRLRRRGRHRLAAALGRRDRRRGSRPPRPHRRARADEPQRRRASATRWRPSTSPPSSTAPAACSAPSPRASGCALLEAIERPSYPPRARSAALTTILGWTTEQVAAADDDAWEDVHRRLHHWARVLREKGVASLMEAITLEEGLPARVLAMVDGERRMTDLRHVGELLHAAAMTEQMGATALTAWLRQRGARGDDRQQRRGAQPPAGERRRGGAGADHAPQQGARVPGRLLPRPVGAVLDPARGDDARHLPRRRRDADDRRRARRPAVEGPRGAARRRAARRGPAARLRRADAREAPGGRVVGGLVRQPQLGAVAAAVRARRRRERGAVGRRACRPTRPPPSASASSRRRPGQRRAGGARADGVVAGRRDRDVGAVGVLVRPRRSTGGGGARRSATSPPAPTRRAWRASRRRPSSTTSPRRTRRRSRTTARDALRAVPSLLADMPVGVEVGTLVHRVFESVDFAAADLSSELAVEIAAAQARRRVELGDTRRVSSRGCAPRSRRRSGRWPAASRCATSPAPTASTSSTSSCRWSAATTRAAPR